MTLQITVRLPDDIVRFVDAEVARGAARSRADVVARALARERRRITALADVAILRQRGTDPDLDALAGHAADLPADLGD